MAAPVSSLNSISPMNYLIVSERDRLTHELADVLRARGHQPIIQDSPTAAATALRSASIDAVVIDGSCPGVNWELVRDGLSASSAGAPEPLEAVERRHIAATLRYTRGNRRNAAMLLGIARSTLLAKIRKYGLDREGDVARVRSS